MKKTIHIFGILFLLSSISLAQNWNFNFDTAKELAAKEKKPLILVFSGSDWCAPCIKLDNLIWKSSEFIEYSKQHLILVKADFPRRKSTNFSKKQLEHNEKLAEKYNKQGYFPLVVIFDATGKVVGETGYKKLSPHEYIQHLESFFK